MIFFRDDVERGSTAVDEVAAEGRDDAAPPPPAAVLGASIDRDFPEMRRLPVERGSGYYLVLTTL